MSGYLPSSEAERKAMLEAIGLSGMDELYADVPPSVRAGKLELPEGQSEMAVVSFMESLAAKNTRFGSVFRGAGAYRHYIPAVVKRVTAKEAFVTAYTPYQAEISQGVLQAIFEYQTMICELTGLSVANASVYDGAAAAAEAVFMCQERKRNQVVVSEGTHPQVIETMRTYCESRDVPLTVIPLKDGATDPDLLEQALGETTACVYFQQPNYFGVIEDAEALTEAAHKAGAKVITGTNPIALGVLKTPGECGADIAVGEGQPLGMPLSYGGPYLGYMACTGQLMRRLPGRIVGQTSDKEGRRAFVLTLQAREQHIRREKASSNICSNEALCAMTAGAYLAAMGPDGLAKAALQCYAKAHYLQNRLSGIGFNLLYNRPFFHEFVTTCPKDAGEIEKNLAKRGILSGLPLDKGMLWCATETNSKEQMDELIGVLKEVCGL